jgi:cytochrome c oxidase subunit 2
MSPGPVLAPSGSAARLDAPLAWALLLGGTLLFMGVMALLARAALGPPQAVQPRHWLIGGGLLLPLAVLGVLAVVNLRHMLRPAFAPAAAAVMGVDAKPWWWQVRVLDPDGGPALVLANELVLPVGRPVKLALASESLIHSLWVPALAGKVDLVPGRLQHLSLQADRAGRWRGPCAEFCGSGHTQMVLNVVALEPADYEAWLRNQRSPARNADTPLLQRGQRHFIELRCGTCHSVRGLVESERGAGIHPDMGGPDLTHLASRQFLGAGTLPNDGAGLRAWITGVQRLKPGARMPSYDWLDEHTVDALVAYLGSLK